MNAPLKPVHQGGGVDGDGALYVKRQQIYPKLVFGKFRAAKWAFLFIALGIYYILPWIRWDRGPNAPNQAVLADFDGGRFYFFWIEIWPQEVHFVTGLLIFSALLLFLVTSLFGRVWCGYACPQTVWTDLFIAVERFLRVTGTSASRSTARPCPLTRRGERSANIWSGF